MGSGGRGAPKQVSLKREISSSKPPPSIAFSSASAGKRHGWQRGPGPGLESKCVKVRGEQMVSTKRRLLRHAWVGMLGEKR